MSEEIPHIGQRRSSSWWEPIFAPNLHGKLAISDWDFEHSTGPQRAYLPAHRLKLRMVNGEVYRLTERTFAECDFQGTFDHKPSILFDRCRFHGCDFAFSYWKSTTFRDCEFKDCSLSLSTYANCEFRDCTWHKIGFSGNKTVVTKCFITNPSMLVGAGFSGCDPKNNTKKHAHYQRYRLEGTKANLARTLLYSHQIVGDDKTYYETARLHDLQQAKSRISHSGYDFCHGSALWKPVKGLGVIFGWMELTLLRLVGLINAWGARLLQPLLALLGSFLMAGLIYSYLPEASVSNPWLKSFDIMMLAGYTNQSNALQSVHLRVIEGIQLLISIFLYTIFFSTAVARFNRTR